MEKLKYKIHLQTEKAAKRARERALYSPQMFQDTHSGTGPGTSQLCVGGGPFSGGASQLSAKALTLISVCAVFLAGSCPEMEMFSCLENRGLLCLQVKADPAFQQCSC